MNQWNQLADIFGCAWNEDEIPESAADNICIAWPSIIDFIDKKLSTANALNVLDYGCGGGMFCRELNQKGFEVTGYDESEELIKIAQCNTPKEVTITNSMKIVEQNGKFDLITAIMVFQFIVNLDLVIANLKSLLKQNGSIIFAVFNPGFIEDNSNNKVFSGFDTYRSGFMELKPGCKIPVYNRTESDYRDLLGKFGFEEVYLDYPVFTKEFLNKYKMSFITKNPEYLIQAFTNKNA